MNIKWEVVKKRGNYRPVLKYAIELEPFEVDLAVPRVVMDYAIARPPPPGVHIVIRGKMSGGGAPLEWYRLMTPSHTAKIESGVLVLPWRGSDGHYEDVQTAFCLLRRDFELVLAKAHDSAPVEIVEHLELTESTRKHIAAGVTAARFLSAVGF